MNKIPYLQTGAAVNYVANVNAAIAPRESAATTSSDDGLVNKTLMNKLYEEGIPVDVDAVSDAISKAERDISLGLGSASSITRSLSSKINEVIKQSEYLKSAEARADKNDALGEIAVGDSGQLFVLGKDRKIKLISASRYNPEKDGMALTVGELLDQRKFNPDAVFDHTMTEAIGNNIGTTKILEYIDKMVKSVGSSDTTQEAFMNVALYIGREEAKKPTESQLLGLQAMKEISDKMGSDAILKVTDLTKLKNIREGLVYIQSILPKNMIMQMQARFMALTGASAEDAGRQMLKIIANALAASDDTVVKTLLDYLESINKAAGTTAAKKSELNRNINVIELLIQGTLGKKDYNLVSSKNPNLSITLHGTGVGALANFDNKLIPKTPVSVVMGEVLGPLVDQNHIFMGDKKVSPGALDSILYDGADVLNIWAPMDSNGDIDFQGLQTFLEILQYIDNDSSMTTTLKNALLKEYGIDGQYDDLGIFHGQGNMGQFLVFTGITSDKVLDPDDNMYADTLTKDEKKMEMQQIDRIYGELNKGNKNSDLNYEFQKGFFSTDIIKAPIFIKLNSTAQIDVGTFSDYGSTVLTRSYDLQVAYDLMRYNQLTLIPIQTPSTKLLYGK